jgi:uncharacterized protein YndB with AHSA1/START domain
MTSDDPAGGRLLGNLRSAEGKGVVRIEASFDTDLDDVWSALTDPSRLSNWIGEVEGDLRLGGEFRFGFSATGSEGTGRVEACEPPRRLLVTMSLGQPDEDVIEATLTTENDQTILVWDERGMPLDQVAAYGAGVQIHVEDLAAYLAGRERREDVKARWDQLQPAYRGLAANLD